jgi:hypothetical protein
LKKRLRAGTAQNRLLPPERPWVDIARSYELEGQGQQLQLLSYRRPGNREIKTKTKTKRGPQKPGARSQKPEARTRLPASCQTPDPSRLLLLLLLLVAGVWELGAEL